MWYATMHYYVIRSSEKSFWNHTAHFIHSHALHVPSIEQDAQALTIEPAEFDRAILRCKMQAKEANMRLLVRSSKYRGASLGLSYDRLLHPRARDEEDTEAAARSAEEEVDLLLAQYQRDKVASAKSFQLSSSVFNLYKGF